MFKSTLRLQRADGGSLRGVGGRWRGKEASAKSGANITWAAARNVALGEGSLSACIMEPNIQKLPPILCKLGRCLI